MAFQTREKFVKNLHVVPINFLIKTSTTKKNYDLIKCNILAPFCLPYSARLLCDNKKRKYDVRCSFIIVHVRIQWNARSPFFSDNIFYLLVNLQFLFRVDMFCSLNSKREKLFSKQKNSSGGC